MPPPAAFFDPRTKAPAFGAYAGKLPSLAGAEIGLRDDFTRRKRWVYVALSNEQIWVAIAVVRTGYAATAFAYAYDRRGRRMLTEETKLAPALASHVADDLHAPGELASFCLGLDRVAMTRDDGGLALEARLGSLVLSARLAEAAAPPAIAAIAPLDGMSLWSATEKRALLPASGRVWLGGEEVALDGAVGGYDYTHGLMPRHTQWRWAFALGQDQTGAPFAFNLTEGFCGSVDGAAFTTGALQPLPEPRFSFAHEEPLQPWRIAAEGVDVLFTPGALYQQSTNLGVVRSRFRQPVGSFSGTIRAFGRDVAFADLSGVVEDQDTVW